MGNVTEKGRWGNVKFKKYKVIDEFTHGKALAIVFFPKILTLVAPPSK